VVKNANVRLCSLCLLLFKFRRRPLAPRWIDATVTPIDSRPGISVDQCRLVFPFFVLSVFASFVVFVVPPLTHPTPVGLLRHENVGTGGLLSPAELLYPCPSASSE
jgi:hypothetical protein